MIDASKYGTVAEAARIGGVNPKTLYSAIRRGDPQLQHTRTAGGTTLVQLQSVRAWKRAERRRGPKVKLAQ